MGIQASESYADFVDNLQKEISSTIFPRPHEITEEYFVGKTITLNNPNDDSLVNFAGPNYSGIVDSFQIDQQMAKNIFRYLIRNEYIELDDSLSDTYFDAVSNNSMAQLPEDLEPYTDQIFCLIHGVIDKKFLPVENIGCRQKINQLNKNFQKQEFQRLWKRINHKAVYSVDFDSNELIEKCVKALETLHITQMRYSTVSGIQNEQISDKEIQSNDSFHTTPDHSSTISVSDLPISVKYDIVGKIAENALVTRRTSAAILSKIEPESFNKFQTNPEQFISKVSQTVIEQKATMIVEHISYNRLQDSYDVDIFTADKTEHTSFTSSQLNKHIYDYVNTESKIEHQFVRDLDSSSEVIVYAKLPRGFWIPTPVGKYNPDWAITIKNAKKRHVYFVAETKGSMSSLQLRKVEDIKIRCAERYFDIINKKKSDGQVKYAVVKGYEELIDLVN